MRKENSLTLPAFGYGWVYRHTARGTDVILEDSSIVHAKRRPDLRFGQYVTTVLKNHLKGGSFDGEIFDAQVLPDIERPDRRPVALIDESNIAGMAEPKNPAKWRHGACKVFALATALEATRRIFVAADPCARERAFNLHKPSACAVAAIQSRTGWTRRTFDLGRTKDNADIGAVARLLQEPSAILVTGLDSYNSIRRLFPTIDAPDVKRRIHRAIVLHGRILVPSLCISEVIPLPLFQHSGR